MGPAGPAGQNGENGTPGANGQDLVATAKAESCATCHPNAGAEHQARYNKYTDTSTLVATIDSVVSVENTPATTPPTYTSTVTFTLKKNGAPFDSALLGQKRYTATKYDPATKKFDTASAITFGSLAPAKDANGVVIPGQYTVKNTTAKFAPETSDAFVYFYFSEKATIVAPKGHYNLYEDVASVAKGYGALAAGAGYTSTANVEACEKCHGSPYAKHGYRVAVVPGIADMVACKACHTDQRVGSDHIWQVLADDPVKLAAVTAAGWNGESPDWPASEGGLAYLEGKYGYVANVMNDTHMSHAMEFAYPQSMANCATCHEGKLAEILTDANFTLTTCKSCHPVTGPTPANAKRAPALKTLMTAGALGTVHNMTADLYTYPGACNTCHKTGGFAKTFNQMHTGYDKVIYSNTAGAKYSSAIKTNVGTVSFDSATKKLTVNFTVTGAAATAIVKPTVVISLYGYDTKDFIVGGHASQPAPDGKRNLEWTEGASGNSPRLTVSPATATAGNATWTATADLTLWSNLLANGTVKKLEIGILPALGVDQTKAPDNAATTTTAGVTSPNAKYNPYLAVAGATTTFDLVGNAVVADAYGKDIVDPAKCNDCHDALGTTFHSPAYGAAGVVGCRLCHVVGSGGSHLEMQSRSIDSYIHAIHSMQPFDIGDIDFADQVEAMNYTHHIESTYPNFTTLNCQSCHTSVTTAKPVPTYNVPDQSKSLPGIISASDTLKGTDRAIGTVPSYVTGPASRACGGCHRAEMLNEDDAGGLASFNAHTAAFGTHLENKAGVFDTAVEKVMSLFK